MSTSNIKPGKYLHYKGQMYEVIGTAHHSETLEELVVYRALYYDETYGQNALWVRPRKMFEQSVIIQGHLVPRFKPIK